MSRYLETHFTIQKRELDINKFADRQSADHWYEIVWGETQINRIRNKLLKEELEIDSILEPIEIIVKMVRASN